MVLPGEGPHDPLPPARVSGPFDPEALLRLLADFGVEYVLAGGFAGVLHGARRPTTGTLRRLDVPPSDAETTAECSGVPRTASSPCSRRSVTHPSVKES